MRNDHLIIALIAIAPAGLSWWWGSRLHRITDDGVLWERLGAMRVRNTAVGWMARRF